MKILQVTTHLNMGGVSRYVLTLSKALKERGAEVAVATSGGELTGALDKCGIAHHRLNMKTKFEFGPKAILSGFNIAGIVRRERIDVLHAHTRVSQVASAIASMITGVPYVTTCHGYFRKRARGFLDTWGVRVIAISDAVRKHLKNDLGVDDSRIALIYSGVDSDAHVAAGSSDEIDASRKTMGLRQAPVIGTIGRLSSVKGQKFLIMAMKEIIEKRPDVQCLIIGNGPEEASLKALAGSLGIGDAVKFIESSPTPQKYLAVMDVFIFPSIKEGLGIALLEALQSGRACIASRIGGIEDVITDSANGILVDVGDHRAIADNVIKLLEDDGFRKRLGEAGNALVSSRFTLGSMTDKISKLYEEAVKMHG